MLHEKHELGKRLNICLKAEENYKSYGEMRVAGRIVFIRIFFFPVVRRKQSRTCTYNATLRRVRSTIVVEEKQ